MASLPSDSVRPQSSPPGAPDLEKAPVADVLQRLAVAPAQGLSAAEAAKRLGQYGPNAIEQKETSLLTKVLRYFRGPIAVMIEAAAVVSAILGHWQDFVIIAALLVFNAALDLWQDRKASNALAALKKGLAPQATRAARRRLEHGRGGEPRARRHREDPPRRDRAGRPAARRGRVCLDRPVGADRRVAAGREEGRRRGLFRQRGQAGRDDRRRHRHRRHHLLRPHREARRRRRRRSATRSGRCSRSATS